MKKTPEYFYSPIAVEMFNESPLLLIPLDSSWLPFSETVRLQYPNCNFSLEASGYRKPIEKYRHIEKNGLMLTEEIIQDHEVIEAFEKRRSENSK